MSIHAHNLNSYFASSSTGCLSASFICDRWDRNHWSTSDQAPCWFYFTPCLRKEKGAWGGNEWKSQLLLLHPCPPVWSAWPNSLSWHRKSQAQSLPQIPGWKAGWPNFSSFWRVGESCFGFNVQTSPFILVSYKRFRPDFEYRWCCGIVGAPGRTKKKKSLFRGNGQHLRKVQSASQTQNPNTRLLQWNMLKKEPQCPHPELLPLHLHLWKLPEAQTTRPRPTATIWPRGNSLSIHSKHRISFWLSGMEFLLHFPTETSLLLWAPHMSPVQ